MPNPSNLYAEKIFAEHPTALWALDENIDYISYIPDALRVATSWESPPGLGTVSSYSGDINPPNLDSPIISLQNSVLVDNLGSAQMVSAPGIAVSSMNQEIGKFSFSAYFYSLSNTPGGYTLGYTYYDPSILDFVTETQFFTSTINEQWVFVSGTFDIPQGVSNISLVAGAAYYAGPDTDHEFLITNISVGQESENFQVESFGVNLTEIESIATITGNVNDLAIPADAYGLQDSKGYYLVRDGKLKAKNTSIPMVYGASNLTALYPNEGSPSLIVPGFGLLNESGQAKEYTLETWIRIQRISQTARRIIGPISSTDGIYLEGLFLKLKLGNKITSYYLGEVSRPMLLDFRLSRFESSVFINGEEVMSLDLADSEIQYSTVDNDWIGFYSYDDIRVVEIDCVAIYPYFVPALVAKRRFAFGQAVESPEGTNKLFGGQVVSFDYKFADYTNNYSYPGIGRWEQGRLDNVAIRRNKLSVPEYSLPAISLKTASEASWLSSQTALQSGDRSFVTFSEDDGYMLFEKAGLYYQDTKAIYGIFSIDSYPETESTLFRLEDSSNNYLKVTMLDDVISYTLKYGSNQEQVLYQKSGVVIGNKFVVSIDVHAISSVLGGNAAAFVSKINNLSLYVANDKTYSSQFLGKIYKVGLCGPRNLQKIYNVFDDLGLLSAEFWDAGSGNYGDDNSYWVALVDGGDPESFLNDADPFFDHIATYTLSPKIEFDRLRLSIDVDSYWEDQLPLSYFSQYVTDIFDKEYYDLDFIQFNIDSQRPEVIVGGVVDTSISKVKSYVTFQYLSTGANAPASNFIYTEQVPENRTITAGENWESTRYEVVDGVVIYPPKGVDRQLLSLVVSIEIQLDDILFHDLGLRSLSLASQAFNEKTSNPVGTKFGIPVFPYRKYGSYFDYKSKNPFVIYKGSSPHLYLTNSSGIEIVGDYVPLMERGFSIPVNPTAALSYRVIASQVFLKSNAETFSNDPVEIFEIQGTEKFLKFYMQADNSARTRARIYCVNARTGAIEKGIAFYVNGKLTLNPIISIDEWMLLGVAFANPLSFDEYVGAFRFVGPLMFDNVAFYESTSLQELQRQSLRSWFIVTTGLWINALVQSTISNYTWNDILVLSSISFFGISPKTTYQSYTGTNKIIVDDSRQVTVSDYQYSVINNTSWSSQIVSAL